MSKSTLRAVLTFAFTAAAAVYARSTNQATQQVSSRAAAREQNSPVLRLEIVGAESKKLTPARFSLAVDSEAFVPDKLNQHGLRFVSVHESKQQVYTVTYARGTGPVEIALPANAEQVTVHAAKGFEYLSASATADVAADTTEVRVTLQRWTNQLEAGWLAADEHVHYDRLDRKGDADWLTMLAGDDLAHAHFMVLKGGKVPGVWAQQYAYGKAGEAFDGNRLIRSGEEYRDSAQGHINLLGLSEVIPPISTGGLGENSVRVNYPPLADVFARNRELGGLGGVAHGGSLGRHPTAALDAVLGAVDFFEIGNAHLYSLELWYQLMNCGYHLPPAAGTDLPNFPFRDDWQPFLGSMRMYVKTNGRRDFAAWKQAVLRGEVVVTSGPMLSLKVNNTGPGGTVRLPATGGDVVIEAELASPIGLRKFELVRMGQPVPTDVEKSTDGPVKRWRIRTRVPIKQSCWLAARGEGVPIKALQDSITREAEWMKSDTIAHTAAIRVLVGDQPIRSAEDAEHLTAMLRQQREFYRTEGRYEKGEHRLRVLELFERGIAELEARHEQAP